jgi:hypothetical protein
VSTTSPSLHQDDITVKGRVAVWIGSFTALTDFLQNRQQNAGNYQGRHAGGELKTVVMAEVQKLDTQAKTFGVSSADIPFSVSSKDVNHPWIHIQ